jgi:subtilisin
MSRSARHLRDTLMVATGAGVRVAVLDSGLDQRFAAVASSKGQSFVMEQSEDGLEVTEVERSVRTDDSGHGSCVHSCVVKAAPEATVDHFRILNAMNHCPSRLLCLALDHVVSKRYQVVNLSLGTRNESAIPWLVSIIKRAYESDVCLVAASSNIGNSLFPGRMTYTISVAASQVSKQALMPSEGNPLYVRFHPHRVVEFSAWGVDVPIETVGGEPVRVSGTSYASGFVAGVCARIIETLGHSNPLDVKLRLRDFALVNAEGERDPAA